MSDLWMDLSNVEAERRLEAVTAVRVATASLWPILAGATDREDFANRMDLVRDRLATAAQDPGILGAVEASLVNDFEILLASRPAPAPEPQPQPRVAAARPAPAPKAAPVQPKVAKGPKCPLCGKAEDTDEHYDEVHANEEVPSHWSDPANEWSLYDHHNIADQSYPANDAGMDIRRGAAAERQGRESSPFVREGATALGDDDLDDTLRDNHWHNTVHDEDIPCDHCGGTIPAGTKYLGNESTWDVVHSPSEAHNHMRRHWRGSNVWKEMTSNEGEGDNPHYVGKNPHKEHNRLMEHKKNLLQELSRPEGPTDRKDFCADCGWHKDIHPGGKDFPDTHPARQGANGACDTPVHQLKLKSLRDSTKAEYKRQFGDLPKLSMSRQAALRVQAEDIDGSWMKKVPRSMLTDEEVRNHLIHHHGLQEETEDDGSHYRHVHDLPDKSLDFDYAEPEHLSGEQYRKLHDSVHQYWHYGCTDEGCGNSPRHPEGYSHHYHPREVTGAFHDQQLHQLRANTDTECDGCGQEIRAGERMAIDPVNHKYFCADCAPQDFDYHHRITSSKQVYEHINDYMSWAKKNGHDPDELSTLRHYEKSAPGVGRSTADKIADQYHMEGPEWRETERLNRTGAIADVPASHIPELNHVHTDHLTDDELMAHLRHEHGLNIEPYRKPNERSHALDHLLEPFGEEGGPAHNHGGQYESFLDSPIQPVASAQEMATTGEATATHTHTAASNLYEPEYEEGLECPHAPYCNWRGFSAAKRAEHIQNRHGGSLPGAKKSASVIDQVTLDAVADAGLFGAEVKALPAGEPRRSFLSRMFRRAKNDENLKEKCPICGKEIPAAEMANHMKKDHPHEAIKPDDETRARDHAAEKKKHHADLSTQDASSATMAPEDDPSLTPQQDNDLPTNMDPKAARLDMIEKISFDLYQANPGLTETQRIHIATQTVNRYPQLVAEARGGADYVDGEKLTECSQCRKPAYSEAAHECRNCGFVRA